jgi:hypothetical protein
MPNDQNATPMAPLKFPPPRDAATARAIRERLRGHAARESETGCRSGARLRSSWIAAGVTRERPTLTRPWAARQRRLPRVGPGALAWPGGRPR